jgi:anti-anti-sigma factor
MQLVSEIVDDIQFIAVEANQLDNVRVQDFVLAFKKQARTDIPVVLDLSAVPLCGSVGFGAFIMCRNHMRQFKGNLAMCAMSPQMRETFSLMRLDLVFRSFGSRQQAIEALTPPAPTL